MDIFHKTSQPYPYTIDKARPLTLQEVLQLRDGIEIAKTREPNYFIQKAFPPLWQNKNYILPLN